MGPERGIAKAGEVILATQRERAAGKGMSVQRG